MGGKGGGFIHIEVRESGSYRETESKEVQSYVGMLPYCLVD